MEFGELLKHVLMDLQSLFRSQVSKTDLSLPQILLLSSVPDEGIDMTTLSRKMGVDPSTMTRLVGVLIRRGWAVKETAETDRRMTLVRLTGKGEKLQQDIETKIEAFGRSILSSYPLEDREEVKEILLGLHWNLSKRNLERI